MAQPFTIERTYQAPIERVWHAITDAAAMQQWYFDIPAFQPVEGFEFYFIGNAAGKDYVHLCRVTEVEEQKKLQYTWSYEGMEGESVVTFELLAEDHKTRVKLTHEGLENFAADPALSRENFAGGWLQIIGTSLPQFVEEGLIQRAVSLHATPQQAWDVLTDPEKVKQWAAAFAEGAYMESTFEKDATVTWYIDGEVATKGMVTQCEPAQALAVTFYDDPNARSGDPLGRYMEHYHIREEGGHTIISIECGPLPIMYVYNHAPMWDEALELMKQAAEG